MQNAKLFGMLSSFLVVLSAVSFIAVGTLAVLEPELLKAFFDTSIKEIHSIGLLGSVLIMTIAALTAFPAELPAIACGAMYGLSSGFLITWVTAMIGASIAFAVGRYVEPSFLQIVVGKKIFSTIRKQANERTGIMALFLIRLVPLFPFFVVNFASGISGMEYHSYMLATGAGIIPGAFVSSAIGAGLVFANTVIVLITLSLFVLTIFSIKIYRRSNA